MFRLTKFRAAVLFIVALVDYALFSIIDATRVVIENRMAMLQLYNDDSLIIAYRLYKQHSDLLMWFIVAVNVIIILLIFRKKKNKGEKNNDKTEQENS
jgi:hypothetical protein